MHSCKTMSANEGPKLNVDDLLFFPGKVLCTLTLTLTSPPALPPSLPPLPPLPPLPLPPTQELNETNIAGRRSPPQPIRLAIGRHGVYKFEREQDKVKREGGRERISIIILRRYLLSGDSRNSLIGVSQGIRSHW